MRKNKFYIPFLLIFFLFFINISTHAAELKLNKNNIELQYGKSYTLTANQSVTWSSSNTKIATVSKSGVVKAGNPGIATITARNRNGIKKTCKVTVQNYVIKKTNNKKYPNKITIYTNGKSKTYTVYNQKTWSESWIRNRGCSACSVAMIESAYGMNYTPKDIHFGAKNKKYSERYALAKLRMTSKVYDRTLTFYSMSKLLSNVGIKNHVVYKYSNSKAVKEITANLKVGKPVIIICHNKTVNGNRLATYIHFLVAAGLDVNNKVIVLNPAGGHVNGSPFTGSFKLTVDQLVKRHMFSCTGNNYKQFFYKNSKKNMGGYLLVDK